MSYTHPQATEVEINEARCRVRIFPVHFLRTFSMQGLGPYDPTTSLSDNCFRKAFFYHGEPAAIEICRDGDALQVAND